jgi:bidirectional [NiFe] hydrogenase diaphorase subunit
MKVKLKVDNKLIQGDSGQNLLQVCLENGIYVPNLCYIEGINRPLASCRLCFVEIDGEKTPVTSCTQSVTGGMVVRTDTVSVRRLQRSALELLLSVHKVDCAHCPANKKCELHKLARSLKVNLKTVSLDKHLNETEICKSHPFLDYYPNRCVLCGKCVFICKERNENPFLSFINRGLDTVISLHWEEDILDIPCDRCLACINICPVGAITGKIQAPCPVGPGNTTVL